VERIAAVKILDPACGSGNFLYVAITLLLDLEKEVIAKAASYGTTLLPQVRPSQLYGLEINPYAAELAQVVIWIGYLQWMHFNGFAAKRDPILEPIHTIRNTDAIIDLSDPDNPKEPEWPEADVIVGNPPFLGDKKMRGELGDDYVEALFALYGAALPNGSDLCCYWFEKSRRHVEAAKCSRAGLLATQGIRGAINRTVVESIKRSGDVFFAESDRDWVLDGASVHVSMIAFDDGRETSRILDGRPVETINADLTSAADTTQARRINNIRGQGYIGTTKKESFDIAEPYAIELLEAYNPHGRPNSDILRPYANGNTITKGSRGLWIIDFGERSLADAAAYEKPFEYVRETIYPRRKNHREPRQREKWWLLARPCSEMMAAIDALPRYLATPIVSKYRLFAWMAPPTEPDHALYVLAESTDHFFGLVQSKPHELWALRTGTRLETRPRYTPTSCFETFPFPEPTADQRDAIAAAAYELDLLRSTWLNPPEWTREEVLTFPGSVDGPWARYVSDANAKGIGTVRYPRVVPADDAAAKKLAKRTLTNLYNERPTWLDLAHKRLDEAVFAAYGWPADLTDDDLLARLLALNLERASAGPAAPAEAEAEPGDTSDSPPARQRRKRK